MRSQLLLRSRAMTGSVALATLGLLQLHSVPKALADEYSFTNTATHYHFGDGQHPFDYVHSAPRVPLSGTVHWGSNAQVIAALVAAGDFNGRYIEAGWISGLMPGIGQLSSYPECMYPIACAYTRSGDVAGITIHSDVQFRAGQRPFFRVFRSADAVGAGKGKWKTSWARGGGWTTLHAGAVFNDGELDWIDVHIEGIPADPDDEVYMSKGTYFDYNSYSNTGFGDSWVWSDNCRSSQIKPWCYSHIYTNEEGCNNCGLTVDPWQSFTPWVGACENGLEACTKRWTLRIQD